MEQHPIPQNISTFQFKLIGDITLKQFVYMAGGVVLAYLMTRISLVPDLLRWPIAAFFALLGFGLAFLPIEERPLDRWLIAFFKSIYSPTQYVWKKSNPAPDIITTPSSQPSPSTSLPVQPVIPVPKISTAVKPAQPTVTLKPYTTVKPPPVQSPKPVATKPPPLPIPPRVAPVPKPAAIDRWTIGAPPRPKTIMSPTPGQPLPDVTGKRIVFEGNRVQPPTPPKVDTKQVEQLKNQFQQKTAGLAEQIAALQKELTQGNIAKERLLELQQLLTQLLTEKDRLSRELTQVRQELRVKEGTVMERPTTFATAPRDTQTTVKIVPPNLATRAGIPRLTSTPNVITGIIKDSAGTLLPNIIVTVKDKDGVPVRALKTNKLGQFAASTPLTDGTYVIDVEDPKKTYQFHRIEVVLSGAVLPPLEISAVSQKDLTRQKLTQELFGKNTL